MFKSLNCITEVTQFLIFGQIEMIFLQAEILFPQLGYIPPDRVFENNEKLFLKKEVSLNSHQYYKMLGRNATLVHFVKEASIIDWIINGAQSC